MIRVIIYIVPSFACPIKEELWNFTKRKKKEVLKGNLILRRKDIKRIRESLMGLLKWRKGKNDKGDGARLPTRRIGYNI